MNVAQRLRANALAAPDKRAIVFPAGTDARGMTIYGHKTYRELDLESDAYARGFERMGITKGTKAILMVKPRPELFSITFAVFKLGAIPVIVDPGMGVKRMLHCYATVGADAFIGIPVAHVVRVANPSAFASLKTVITVGRRWFWGGHSLDDALDRSEEPFPIAATSPDDLLNLNFTTGSTGPAKGVEYTHGMADAMVGQIESHFAQGRSNVSLAPLPLFAIFDLLIGSTSVLPPMDPTKPALVDPERMIAAINEFRATHMFASPAFLHRVGQYARDNGKQLPSLEVVISGGAPVGTSIIECFRASLSPGARLHTTYGATEALPISSIEYAEIVGETSALTCEGRGTCVGRPMPGLEARILRISDGPFETWSEDLFVRDGDVGEIAICGPNVSRRYHEQPRANALTKIADGDRIWHRTGDLGSKDEQGRLWFGSRKSQRVITPHGPLFPVQWEGVFNAHPDVYRSALVGVGPAGRQEPVICIELRKTASAEELQRIERELRDMAAANPLTRSAKAFLFHPSFPVDIRHNAKIGREELATWAARLLGSEGAQRSERQTHVWMRIVPILGWLFLFYGLVHPFEHAALRFVWLVDVFLSVVVHGLQLFVSLPAGKRAGYSTSKIVFLTFLFGATWWKSMEPMELRGYPALRHSAGRR